MQVACERVRRVPSTHLFSSSNNNIGRQKELRGGRPVGYVSGVQRRGDEAQEGAVARIAPDIGSILIPLSDRYRECVAIEWMNINHIIKSNMRERRTYFSILNNPWLIHSRCSHSHQHQRRLPLRCEIRCSLLASLLLETWC